MLYRINILKVMLSKGQLISKQNCRAVTSSKKQTKISAQEVYYFKANTKRESMFFLQEDKTLFCTNLEVVNLQGRNP